MTSSSTALSHVSDSDLMLRLREIAHRYRGITVELLAHLAEVDARRLCGRELEGSLFNHCVKVLNFSENEAGRRIAAARAARRYPVILDLVARGDLHLTAVGLLAPHLTDENHRELLAGAVRKSKREVLELLAAWFPKPDAPTLLRRLPEPASPKTGASVTALHALERVTAAIASDAVPRAVRRAVAERDGGQCTFRDASGRRCQEHAFLEFHHLQAHARGGPATVDNLALRCWRHHDAETVREFGPGVVPRRRSS